MTQFCVSAAVKAKEFCILARITARTQNSLFWREICITNWCAAETHKILLALER